MRAQRPEHSGKPKTVAFFIEGGGRIVSALRHKNNPLKFTEMITKKMERFFKRFETEAAAFGIEEAIAKECNFEAFA